MLENTYANRPLLKRLPTLVRKQRRLERQATRWERAAAAEKLVRDQIDALLLEAGLAKGQGVTCLGYDVVHNERAGRSKVNPDKLRGAGVAELDIQFATETGQASSFATVRPMKGAQLERKAA